MAAGEFGAIAVACAAMATGDAPGGAVGVTRVGASARVGVAAARDRRICWLVPSPGDRRLCSASTATAVVVVVAGPRWWRNRGAESERGVGRWLGSRTGGSDGATVTTKTLGGVRFQMRYSPNGSCISLQGNGVIKAQRAFSPASDTVCVCGFHDTEPIMCAGQPVAVTRARKKNYHDGLQHWRCFFASQVGIAWQLLKKIQCNSM